MRKEAAEALLPKVGDVRMEILTIDKLHGIEDAGQPQRCTVVEVNHDHLWYRVRFDCGFHETYKVPKVKPNAPKEARRK